MGQLSKKNKKFSIKDNKIIKFDVEISNIEPINSEFSKALVKVMYANGNRNGSYFDKDMIIDKMIPTIFNIPVVGHYLENKDDFGSHDSKIELTSDGDINFIDETVPYGVVNESSEITWQLITEENNSTHDYLCCTCILWTGRYPQVQRVIDEGNHQSMEVNVIDGYDDETDGLYHVTDAEFSALTILGQDVEPCFESSSIEKYSFDKFKEDFSLMLKEIKNSLNPKSDNKKSSDFDLNNKSNKKEDDDMKLTKKEIAEKFSLTAEQVETELRRLLKAVTYIDEDWYGCPCECRKYYLIDYDDIYAYAEDEQQEIFVKIPFSKAGDDIVLDLENASRIKFAPEDWMGTTPEGEEIEGVDDNEDVMEDFKLSLKSRFDKVLETKIAEAIETKEIELNSAFEKTLEDTKIDFESKLSEKDVFITDLTEKFNKSDADLALINSEIEDLKAYKLQKETDAKEAKFAEYVDELSEEDIKPIKDKMTEFSLETIDEKLKITFANKNHKPSKNSIPKFNGMGLEHFDWNNNDSKSETNEDVWTRLENKKNN